MPRTTVMTASIERLEILAPDGTADLELMPDLDDGQMVAMYQDMVRMRAFDAKAIRLQRQGRMGTWASLRGQEAAQAALALAMEPQDWLIPAIREQGLALARGVPGHVIYAYWAGDERGSAFPEDVRVFPTAVPIGSQLIHGAGVGMSMALQGDDAVAVAFGGDGSTSEGDFHEALNFAGVFRAQTVFVIQNNQWAISVPRASQSAAETLAQKAIAYGIPGIQVDGNDVFAVYVAAREALDRARRGDGPTLIESVTYRLGDHTTADDAGRYRDPEEVAAWETRDPILRLRRFLEARGLWDEPRERMLTEEVDRWVESQVEAMEAMPDPDPRDIFRFMYAELPPHLAEQMEELLEEVRS
ncbi:MAG TPA: pyruvate dehydrogenase (acetyl-transferring) E1 component subunit alpha [Acidobacteria bacterium]|nr:pyruvate dehydrogenase (acetyl-transferring) E1 component subunit alpha [Acidobacteriota bacterium]